MVLFIRVDGGDGKNSETNATATNVIPPHPEDEDPNVASLGGARMPALWFERDLHNLASTSGLSAKYPTAQDVEKELKYWFNSIGFDLEQYVGERVCVWIKFVRYTTS